MQRREVVRLLGAAGALPFLEALTAQDLFAAGRALHARIAAAPDVVFKHLTAHEGATVTAIAELIIPETDTVGATSAGVPAFIDLLVGEWYRPDERDAFLAGLREVDERSRRVGGEGADFVDLERGAQTSVLLELEADAAVMKASGAAYEPFFARMKWLTLFGYYTSAQGATEELHFEMIPGRFDGCTPALLPERR